MVVTAIGNAFKKMSQRAMWRGDREQSSMIENHGMMGVRSNLLNDTPSYKKEAIGLNAGSNFAKTSAGNKGANKNSKTIPTNVKTSKTNSSLGGSILNSL